MDLSQAVIARSDQLNADDLIGGPRTFTVKEVRRGDAEQPVSIVLAEYPANRPFKPSKTVVRILAHAWGEETDNWPENPRLTLFRDAKVKWAGAEIGGIRISHMSHIDGQLKIALAESKGKKTLHTINPLKDAPKPAATPPPSAKAEEMRAALMGSDVAQDKWLTHIGEVIGRTVAHPSEMNDAEMQQVIDSLATAQDQLPTGGDDA